nr:ribonuclease H-like domain-containing protein [Tanacetum cinerariifolium]
MESQSETTQTVSTLKLLVLKTREYDLWSMRMEQYITFTDHALWEVIVNGDPVSLVASSSTGVEGPIPPKTAEQKLARKNKLKAKSTLMLAIPGEHLLKFHACKDAKSLLETIKNRTKVECYNCHKRGHFAREYKALRNQRNKNKDAPTRNAPMDTSTTNALVVQDGTDGYQMGLESLEAIIVIHEKNEAVYKEDIAFLKYDVQVKDISIKDLKNQLENALKEKDDLKLKLEKFETSSKNLTKLINSQISVLDKTGFGYDGQMNESDLNDIHVNESEVLNNVFDSRESDEDDNQVNDRDTTVENENKAKKPRKFSQSPRGNKRNWNGLMTQKLRDGFEFKKKACFVCGSINHLIKDYDFYENKMVLNNKGKIIGPKKIRPVWDNTARVNHQNKLTRLRHKRNFVPDAFLTKSKQVPVNAAKQSSNRAAASVSAARHVNIAASKPNVNKALPTAYSYFKAHSPVNNVTTARPKAVVGAVEGNKNNAVKSLACWIWRPKGNLIDHISKDNGSYTLKRFNYVNPQGRLKSDQGIFDSRCSRHMTGKKSYIIDYQEINGGFVAFRENAKGAKITRKAEVDVVQRLKEKALRD